MEEKKPGNLSGSFSVFEIVSDTQQRLVKPTVKRGGVASRKQQERVHFDYGPASTGAFRTFVKVEDATVFNKEESLSMNSYNNSSVPYIETGSIQSLYGGRPFSDF